jgi:formiminoglutamase
MSLNDYFEPVSLERSDDFIPVNQGLFCQSIYIHTPDNPIRDLASFQVAIIGITESRGCPVKGVDLTPDIVREKLYQLSTIEKSPKIIDLGNLKQGKDLKDTYFGLRDVILELLQFNITPIIIGGSHDLTYGIFLAFEYLQKKYTLTTIDNRIDVAFDSYEKITFKNYLNSVILENKHLFEYLNIGQQACFASTENADLFENLFFESIRLGSLRNNLLIAEPYLRDSTILSIDFSALRNADAPGQAVPSPNGFNAEDICQIARYAGFGEGLKIIGLFDISPNLDNNLTTCCLAAQTIWYFLDGFSIRVNENPALNPDEFKNFIVTFDEENTLVFYKSLLTQRWWCEVPVKNDQKHVISCAEADYVKAGNNEIPDRWLKMLKKLN